MYRDRDAADPLFVLPVVVRVALRRDAPELFDQAVALDDSLASQLYYVVHQAELA